MRNLASLFPIIIFGLLVSARGDLTIVQRVEGVGQNGEVTVKIKGDKERIDAPSQPTRIIDGKTGEMTDVLNEKKSFVRISAEQMRAAAETINKFDESKQSSASKPKSSFSRHRNSKLHFGSQPNIRTRPGFSNKCRSLSPAPGNRAIWACPITPISPDCRLRL